MIIFAKLLQFWAGHGKALPGKHNPSCWKDILVSSEHRYWLRYKLYVYNYICQASDQTMFTHIVIINIDGYSYILVIACIQALLSLLNLHWYFYICLLSSDPVIFFYPHFGSAMLLIMVKITRIQIQFWGSRFSFLCFPHCFSAKLLQTFHLVSIL